MCRAPQKYKECLTWSFTHIFHSENLFTYSRELIWSSLPNHILWCYSRRSLNRTWTSQQKKSALNEKKFGIDQTSNGRPSVQQCQQNTGMFLFFCIDRGLLTCFRALLWCSKELIYIEQVVSFSYCTLLFLLRDQANPCQAKPHEEDETKSQCDSKKDQRSVSQHAHERRAPHRAWQNWCD